MVNLVAFLNMFMSYLLVFVIFAVVIVAGFFVGRKIRLNKNEKELANQSDQEENKN